MKNAWLLFSVLLMFGSCDKRDYSHPMPASRPKGLGNAKFTFSISYQIYEIDSLKAICGYQKDTIGPGRYLSLTKWESKEFNFKEGDSLWTDVRVWGRMGAGYSAANTPWKGIQRVITYNDPSAPPVTDSIREEAFIAPDSRAGAPFTYHAFGAWKF